jgi:hypothetical protein
VKVILAFDFMRLSFRDCLWAHAMNPALTLAFPPEEEKEEEELEREAEGAGQRVTKRSQASGRASQGRQGRAEEDPPAGSQARKTKKQKSEGPVEECAGGGEKS